jgi:hypothetical protein
MTAIGDVQGRLHGRRWYNYMEVIGRVEFGTETENCAWSKQSSIRLNSHIAKSNHNIV